MRHACARCPTRTAPRPTRSTTSRPPRRTTVGWIAIIVFAFLAGVGDPRRHRRASVYVLRSPSDLDPPAELTQYVLPEETVLLDRTGEVELARFGDFKRDIVAFDEIPPIMLDATTAIEDKTFWENAGFDPLGIVAAGIDSLRGNSRGASTITQQLVRARLLDQDLRPGRGPDVRAQAQGDHPVDPGDPVLREQGDDGKQEIITAYLNQIYYGNQSYGVKAAARSYFGKELGGPDAGRGGDPRRAPPVAVQLRPGPQRDRESATSSRRTTQPVPRPTAT